MKKIILAAAALSMVTTMAFAGATIDTKTTNSNGTAEGQGASSYTGNGDYVGGNGTSGVDQTTGPGSRVDAKIAAGVYNGNGHGQK